ncbi:basement membrane-specific heparan sulfate proteoglycan core protein-like, partial [Micropterus dolomieu]|uniref:basement membrane-specific heparan sulfate proteoglycan core protein-like n=1 Tax=Micropterus dolomieu TaxID=147949 RepID=UPI001E8E0854
MIKAMSDVGLHSLPCAAHTIQLVVNEGLLAQRSVADAVAVGRRIVGHFQHSALAYSRLEDIQMQLNMPIRAEAGYVIPAVTVLQKLLTKETDEDHGIKTMKGTLFAVVKRRFTDTEKNPLYCIGTVSEWESLVIQSQNDWGVTYTSTEICAFKGSTVEINCTYTYPSRINGNDTTVEKTFWFKGDKIVDLKTKSEYSGRVEYNCYMNYCTLRFTDLRESDSAEYKFRFITNQPGGTYTGSPGVTLSVTDLQVQVSRLQIYESYNWAELKCHSSCLPPGHPSYIWYKNGQNISEGTSYSAYFYPADSFSCAVRGYEKSRSPSVYAPKLPSVSVSPSAEIVEGSSVTLTCSSDANPAANYTWYKYHGNPNLHLPSKEPQLILSSILPSDSGEYYCAVENDLGMRTSGLVHVNVK